MVKRRNKKERSTINRLGLLSLLKKIYLGGAIDECVIQISKGQIEAEVVDITNNIVVITNSRSASPKLGSISVGLGSVDTILKFLGSISAKDLDVKISGDGSRFELGVNKWKRKLNYLASMPELISTRLRMDADDDTNYKKQFKDMAEVSFELTQEDAKDLISYISVVRSKIVTITANEEDLVKIVVGKSTEHQFELTIEEDLLGDDPEGDFVIVTNGENLAKVLAAVEFDEDNPPMVGLAEDSPITITDGDTIWGLTPVEDLEGE